MKDKLIKLLNYLNEVNRNLICLFFVLCLILKFNVVEVRATNGVEYSENAKLVKFEEEIDGFSTCDFNIGDEILCEEDRLIDTLIKDKDEASKIILINNLPKTCEKFSKEKNKEQEKTIKDTFNTNKEEILAFYPINHICNRYKDASLNNKYKKVPFKKPNINLDNGNSFRIYYSQIYLNCNNRSTIQSFASNDYISYRNNFFNENIISFSNIAENSIISLNKIYFNLIKLVTDNSKNTYLYEPLKKSTEKVDGYLTCDFKKNDFFLCDSQRLYDSGLCTTTITINNTEENIDDCDKFDKQKSIEGTAKDYDGKPTAEQKKACYPKTHICNTYKTDLLNKYYSIDIKYFDNTKKDDFYIYSKNIVFEGANKNCELNTFKCDVKLKNESNVSDEINVVYKDTADKDNLEFIENIFGNLGINSFYKYVGTCKRGVCGDDIMKSAYYFKYINKNASLVNNDDDVLYFTKNISYKTIGKLCKGYLPNCKYIYPNESMNALYNNSNTIDSSNNINSRLKFYESYSDGFSESVKEEHLWFANNNNFSNNVCLSIIDNKDKAKLDYDVGYCSDLTDDKNGLKYQNGLESGYVKGTEIKAPNCYLKSCIDLTAEELNMIIIKGNKNKKYCSEYYWLENKYGFKYFPKEKPVFCSELEDVKGYNKQLRFRLKTDDNGNEINTISSYDILDYDNCKIEIINNNCAGKENCSEVGIKSNCSTKGQEYYSYGGGINKERNNCYLKSCFSLNDAERKIIANTNLINIGKELSRIDLKKYYSFYNFDYSIFDEEKIPLYCDDTFLKSSNYNDNFVDINLNIIPCYKLSDSANITIADNRVLNFTDGVLKSYNTTNSNKFCRSNYTTISRFNMIDENNSFFNTLLAYSKESLKNTSYNKNVEPYSNFVSTEENDFYFKLTSDNLKQLVPDEIDYNIYTNLCEYVDNSVLYYNTTIPFIENNSIEKFFDKNLLNYLILINSLSNNEENSKNNFLNKYVYKCDKYRTTINNKKIKSFDCGLFDNSKLSNDIIKLFSKNVATAFQNACLNVVESQKPDERPEVTNLDTVNIRSYVRTDEHNWLIKPTPIENPATTIKPNDDKKLSYLLSEVEGCTYYNNISDGLEKNKYNIPSKKSFYINTTEFSDPQEGQEVGFKKDNFKKTLITICSRFSDDNESTDNKCGIREGSENFDKCLELKINDVANIFDYNTKINCFKDCMREYYGNIFTCSHRCFAIKEHRFRTLTVDDHLLAFKDVRIDSKVNSNNPKGLSLESIDRGYRIENDIKNKQEDANDYFGIAKIVGVTDKLYDLQNVPNRYLNGKQYQKRHIAAKGSSYPNVGLLGTPACATYAAGAALYDSFIEDGKSYSYYFFTCIAAFLFDQSDSTVRLYEDSYLFYMSNQFFFPKDYRENGQSKSEVEPDIDIGFISKATLFNNNNYLYRYYPRSLNIEEDIANKLQLNVDSNGNRFYYNTVLSRDIIEHCKLNKLIGHEDCTKTSEGFEQQNPDATDYDGSLKSFNSCNYVFHYYKLNEKGEHIGNNEVCEERIIEKEGILGCLADNLKECVKSYGVNFIHNNTGITNDSEIDDDFLMKNGAHLKSYKECDSLFSCNKDGEAGKYIPIAIIPYTDNYFKTSQLKERQDCKLDKYGDPIGDLAKCRGFEYDGLFYTESQAIPRPLYTHPFMFYTLITPRNTPELFNPTFFLSHYYSFKDYKLGSDELYVSGEEREVSSPSTSIVDFFNPKFKFKFEYVNGVNDPDFVNILSKGNDFVSEIPNNKKMSYPYVVKYQNLNNPNNTYNYKYVLDKTFKVSDKGTYMPEVCVYRINIISSTNTESGLNSCLNIDICEGKGCAKAESVEGSKDPQCFTIIDNDIECYNRSIPFLDNFIFKPDINIYYNKPYINAYLRPKNIKYETIIKNEDLYVLKEGDSKQIMESGKNNIQGFAINFERSYCSQAYYDYYTAIDKMKKEELKTEGKDISLINRLKTQILKIETIIIPDCNSENGEESEFLINENELKSFKETANLTKVINKEVAKVRKYNESYGGFNEICLADADINNIIKIHNKQNYSSINMPNVVAFNDVNKRNRRTKCLLNRESMRNPNCLIADEVYIYCNEEEKGVNLNCVEKLNINNFKKYYIKKINCRDLLYQELNEDNIEKIKACYKGGFNGSKNIYNKEDKLETSCNCETPAGYDRDVVLENFFSIRKMTPREYGLCVDLVKPNVCPAVKYYDESKRYVDDNLALGMTKDELKEVSPDFYEQHLWRTDEKQMGVLPSVFFSYSLGNAEFEESIYCEADKNHDKTFFSDNCIGGSQYISGQCNGYWRWNNKMQNAPTAICTAVVDKNSNSTIYEYKLINNYVCERYICPNVLYDDKKGNIIDEKDIDEELSDVYTTTEVDSYSNINITDYKSFVNDEESSYKKVDMRGSSHGFATWKGLVSSDFALDVTSDKCLTGFGPAGSNYLIKNNINSNINNMLDKNNIVNYDNLQSLKEDYKVYIQFIKKQSSVVENIINTYVPKNKMYYPSRRCNQKGKWMTVNDVYNLYLIDKDNYNNYYYNDPSNFWLNIYNDENNYSGLPENFVKYGGYCERLVCTEIEAKNKNIYNDEFFADKGYVNKYSAWNHTGGAHWDNVTAPRNSSNKINNSSVGSNSSRNVQNIFMTIDDDGVHNKYKFLRKTYGTCKTDYGYYNRGTAFITSTFQSQLNSLIGNNIETDPRKTNLIANEEDTKKPERVCTSDGLWGDVSNRCFRSCEMMDIYYTKYTDYIYKRNNFVPSDDFFVENNDIEYINKNGLTEDIMEEKFQSLKLEAPEYKNPVGYTLGDYLTGGARWPRVLVNEDSKLETNGPKKGLRYIEVESDCDSSFSVETDNRVRQYVMSSDGNKPTRRCYEDGSWSSVYSDSRCILGKNCKSFTFTLYDLYLLMIEYNKKPDLNIINKLLSNTITYGIYSSGTVSKTNISGDNCSSDNLQDCPIYDFDAVNTSVDKAISENPIIPHYNYFIKNNPDLYPLICNSTTEQKGDYMSGWSLNTENIGAYFIPATCNRLNDNNYYASSSNLDIEEVRKYINRLVYDIDANTAKTDLHYVRETNLNYLYNNLNVNPNTGSFDITLDRNETKVEDETDKNIEIGNKKYNSFQILAHCDNTYFYNKFDDECNVNNSNKENNDGSNCKYKNKNIILECRETDKHDFKFMHNKNTAANLNKNNQMIRAADCLPKKCGGSKNRYQSNWSESIINEVTTDNKFNIIEKNSESYIQCDSNHAFVLDETNDLLSKKEQYLVYYRKPNGESEYKLEQFVNKISTKCTNQLVSENKTYINGKKADEIGNSSSYDINRYGELVYKNLPTRFCKDIYKRRCFDINEETIMRTNGFTEPSETNTSNNSGFCVRMACSGKNLKFTSNGEVLEDQNCKGNNKGAGCFDLPLDFYNFGTNVIIESIKGDYTGVINQSLTLVDDNKYVVYSVNGGTPIKSGNPCGQNEDIYNFGKPTPFDFYKFIDNKADTEKNNINNCFGNLENTTTISETNKSGYEKISNNLYVKYNMSYIAQAEFWRGFNKTINDYKPSESVQTDLRNKTAEFIVNNLIFNGSELNNNYDISTDLNFKKIINDLISNVKAKTRIETDKYFNSSDDTTNNENNTNNVNNNFFCYYPQKEAYKETNDNEFVEISPMNYSGPHATDINKYKNYSEKLDQKYYEYKGKTEDDGSDQYKFIAIPVESNDPICKDILTKTEAVKNIPFLKVMFKKVTKCFAEPPKDLDFIKDDSNTDSCTVIANNNTANEGTDSITGSYYYKFDRNDYLCFYKIDKGESRDSSDKNIIVNTDPGEYYRLSSSANDVYWEDGTVNVFNACENSINSYIKTTEDITGTPLQNIKVYNDKYEELYRKNIAEEKAKLIEKIKQNPEDVKYKKLYDEYYNMFNMENFLLDETNFDNYNKYVTEYSDNDLQITIERDKNGSISFIYTNASGETISEFDLYVINAKLSNNDKFECFYGNGDNYNNINNINKFCKDVDFSIKNKMKTLYEEYFIKFFEKQKDKIKTKYEDFNSQRESCNKIFKAYFDEKSKYDVILNDSKSKGDFNSGLFMAMECTPKGWRVYDKPSCKKRCTGRSDLVKVTPYNLKNETHGFKIEVNNLRYTKTVRAYIGSRIAACVSNKKGATGWGEIGVKCDSKVDDSNVFLTEVNNISLKYGNLRNWNIHKNWLVWKWRYSFEPYYSFENVVTSCKQEWGNGASYAYLHCVGANGVNLDNRITILKIIDEGKMSR